MIRFNWNSTDLHKTLKIGKAWNFLKISNLQLKNQSDRPYLKTTQSANRSQQLADVTRPPNMTYFVLLPPTCPYLVLSSLPIVEVNNPALAPIKPRGIVQLGRSQLS